MHKISNSNLELIRNAAINTSPNEICGLLIYKSSTEPGRLVFLENQSTDKSFFSVNPDELFNYLTEYYERIYFFHSHPTCPPIPSIEDKLGYFPYSYPHLIYSVRFNQFVMYTIDRYDWEFTNFKII